MTTAVFAYLAGSVQTDIKSALSFASLSQVGIIVAEIGLGFRYVALVHILGHACLRTLQFVRAPTLLHDYHTMENAIGGHLPRGASALGWLDAPVQRLALPVCTRARISGRDACAITWQLRSCGCSAGSTRSSAGGPTFSPARTSRESEKQKPHFGTIEEFS